MTSIDPTPSRLRPLEEEEPASSNKRVKISHDFEAAPVDSGSLKPLYSVEGLLPKSLSLLGLEETSSLAEGHPVTREIDVGISEYISAGVSKIEAIIKQRFTDFLVYEVDQTGKVLRLRSIEMPDPTAGFKVEPTPDTPVIAQEEETGPKAWDATFETRLQPFMSAEAIRDLEKLYSEGPAPPEAAEESFSTGGESSRGGSRGRGRGRGGRGGGRGGRAGPVDNRRVASQPVSSKEERTQFHKLVRELFTGQMESQVAESIGGEGPRIIVKWQGRGGRGGRGSRGGRGPREVRPPPYIHFTLQKTNRDTQDALSKIARSLSVAVKDLSVAGTKDKRGVTTQRVSFKRGKYLLVDAWKTINGLQGRRRTEDQALKERGERGIRIADMEYQQSYLELGMLKGNAFIITLRNVKVDTTETIDLAMQSIKQKGFINYYGMQRFGTAAIPTHAVGLAVLKSDWDLAVSLLLRPRPGEHPEVEKGRRAWLEDGDLTRALELIPRRCVAERCILEYYEKHKSRSPYDALTTIPRNLRLMYVHAYQSYVWNAVVSERIRLHGCEKPIAGDLVYDKSSEAITAPEASAELGSDAMIIDPKDVDAAGSSRVLETPAVVTEAAASNKAKKAGGKKEYVAPKVKILSESDVDAYTMFDVIMPLPGRDVAYPGGKLGERFKEFLKMDGLDPDNLVHTNKDYTLLGSYRTILHLPKELSWSVMRYTDPNVPLAQSDEDRILDFDPPNPAEDGKFMALQINLQLGTAAYATMAIREITKTDTGSQAQSMLTLASEDQAFKGTVGGVVESEAVTAAVVEDEEDEDPKEELEVAEVVMEV